MKISHLREDWSYILPELDFGPYLANFLDGHVMLFVFLGGGESLVYREYL